MGLTLPNSATTLDVFIVRELDGTRVVLDPVEGLTAAEVLVLHAQHEMLPGRLLHFHAVPTPRPWERKTDARRADMP